MAFDEERFTAEEIVSVTRAGEAGEKLVDLCQSVGIMPETYYAWKARYSGLAASQVHDLRRRAHLRKRRVTLLAWALCVAIVGVSALMALRSSNASTSAHAITQPVADASKPLPQQSEAAGSKASADAPQVPDGPRQAHDEGPASTDYFAADGYSVQVAAMPDLQQARTALEKLVAAGHAAHLTTKTIKGVEMYRVRVGPFGTRHAAAQVAERLSHDGYKSSWITR